MTDHTCTEKIGGDSIYFCGHPSRAGNRYDRHVRDVCMPMGLVCEALVKAGWIKGKQGKKEEIKDQE